MIARSGDVLMSSISSRRAAGAASSALGISRSLQGSKPTTAYVSEGQFLGGGTTWSEEPLCGSRSLSDEAFVTRADGGAEYMWNL